MLSAGPPRLFPGRQERSAADRVRAAVRPCRMAGRDRGFQGQYCRPRPRWLRRSASCAGVSSGSSWSVTAACLRTLVSAKTSSLRDSIGSAPCARPGSVLWSPTARCNPPFSTTSAAWPRSRAKNFTPESDSWSAATPLLAKERARKREESVEGCRDCARSSGGSDKTVEEPSERREEHQRARRPGRLQDEEALRPRNRRRYVLVAPERRQHRRRGPRSTASTSSEPACRRNSSTLARPLLPTKNLSARAFRTFKLIDLNVRPIHHRLESPCARPICCYACWPIMSNATCASSLHQCCPTMKTDRCGPRLWLQNQSPHSARLPPGEPLTAIPSTASDPCSTTSPLSRETAFGPGSLALGNSR